MHHDNTGTQLKPSFACTIIHLILVITISRSSVIIPTIHNSCKQLLQCFLIAFFYIYASMEYAWESSKMFNCFLKPLIFIFLRMFRFKRNQNFGNSICFSDKWELYFDSLFGDSKTNFKLLFR